MVIGNLISVEGDNPALDSYSHIGKALILAYYVNKQKYRLYAFSTSLKLFTINNLCKL